MLYAIIYWINDDYCYPLTYKDEHGYKALRLFATLKDADKWAGEMEANPFDTIGVKGQSVDCRVISTEGVKE